SPLQPFSTPQPSAVPPQASGILMSNPAISRTQYSRHYLYLAYKALPTLLFTGSLGASSINRQPIQNPKSKIQNPYPSSPST
ncbi:MAG: hypothetical protein MJA27_13135, partial [Pseudanabaenales cyanobacterium]|nr:hypothetical protein [Pseudanabaenales cyanobacterium]